MDLKLERNFELKICVDGPYERWTKDVIKGIENDSLMVFDSKEINPFSDIGDYEDVDKFIEEKARVKIKISEYLPLACQCIRFIDEETDIELKKYKEEEPGIPACYWSNIKRTILFPRYKDSLGPSAYIGEIIFFDNLTRDFPRQKGESEEPFKCVIAHELVHAFNKMIFIVPAFSNWDEFLKEALENGSNVHRAMTVLRRLENNIDSRDNERGLRELKKYWPNNAEKWFNAWQDMKKKK